MNGSVWQPVHHFPVRPEIYLNPPMCVFALFQKYQIVIGHMSAMTNHQAVKWPTNVSHRWWNGSLTREASWQVSHQNFPLELFHTKMLKQKPQIHTRVLMQKPEQCSRWFILDVAVTDRDICNIIRQTAPGYTTLTQHNSRDSDTMLFRSVIVIKWMSS